MGSTYQLLEGKERKKNVGGKNKKKRSCVWPAEFRTLALHAYTVYQHIGPQSVCDWSGMHYCIAESGQ